MPNDPKVRAVIRSTLQVETKMNPEGNSFELASNSGLAWAMELDIPVGYCSTGFW